MRPLGMAHFSACDLLVFHESHLNELLPTRVGSSHSLQTPGAIFFGPNILFICTLFVWPSDPDQ